MLLPLPDAGASISIAVSVAEHRSKFAPALRRMRSRLLKGHLRIATFGPGGTGKTTLGHLFSNNFMLPTEVNPYQRSMSLEPYSLPGEIVCSLLVPPGQERYNGTEWKPLFDHLSHGKVIGIINLVSWGYHSFREVGYNETKYFQPGMDKKDFLESYLQSRRRIEIELARQLVQPLVLAPGKIWMMTLVTKQDLWWDERLQVQKHYMEGEYHQSIQEIMNGRGEQNFRHEYVSASLILNNFVDGNGEVLKPTTAGYDQRLQLTYLHGLSNSLLRLVRR